MEENKVPAILWFALLPRPLMFRAMYYAKKNHSLYAEYKCLHSALILSFEFSSTKEGFNFWHDISISVDENPTIDIE